MGSHRPPATSIDSLLHDIRNGISAVYGAVQVVETSLIDCDDRKILSMVLARLREITQITTTRTRLTDDVIVDILLDDETERMLWSRVYESSFSTYGSHDEAVQTAAQAVRTLRKLKK